MKGKLQLSGTTIKLPRRSFSLFRWRTRGTLWCSALLAGAVVVFFAKAADYALSLFFQITAGRPWIALILTPSVGMLTVFLTRRFAPGAEGSGIPQVIAATKLAAQGQPVGHLVSIRIAVGKIGLGILALFGGFSAGREGPSVQVASSILHTAHRFLPHTRALRTQDLILAGGAAGISAAFNTPLAGIVFAVEELGRRLESRTSGILVSTIIIAGLASLALVGNYNYFGHLVLPQISQGIVVPIIVCGITCGLLGGAFSWLLLLPQRHPHHVLWRTRQRRPIAFAGICGLLVATIGILSSGISFGSGYAVASEAVVGDQALPWYATLARIFATVLTYYSGLPGGIFAPSLAAGASLGSQIALLLGYGTQATPLIALCMAGFLAAVTQSPITATIIVMEMIDGHEMVFGLLAITLLSRAVSSRIAPELYQRLSRQYRREGVLPSDDHGR